MPAPRDLADELLRAKVKARLFGGDHAPRVGRLVVLERIGGGAQGAVYAAYDPHLDRNVAIKVLHAADPEARGRALVEARALAKLAHPNVIAIHDVAEEDDAIHIVMELATGTPLRAWIHKARTWRDVLRVMREAARGLAAAHHAGVIHRDVKPDNILVGEDRTRIVDFGLAELGDSANDGAGTPNYMAPEVLAREPATARSDQFSFAVTLYEALYGERPHVGTTRDELRRAALVASSARPGRRAAAPARAVHDATPAGGRPTELAGATVDDPSGGQAEPRLVEGPRGLPTQPPMWLHAIVGRALSADPTQRFPSMDALVTALSRDRRRKRIFAAIAAGALVVGAVGGAVVASARAGSVDRCDGSTQRARVWSAGRSARIQAALAGPSNARWAAPAIATLEGLATGWEVGYRGVCEATRVHGAQSDRLLELRMRCLDRVLARFDALASELEGPLELEPRLEAPAAIAQLPRPDACRSLTDAGSLALPAEPAQRTRALAAERTLDRAWTSYALSRYRDARTQVANLDAATTDLDAPALRASILVLGATLESRIGDPGAARLQLERALTATAGAHATDLEYLVWTRALRHQLFAGTPAHVIEWAPFARAAAQRAGLEGAEIEGIVGEALRDAGQLAAAREHLTTALAARDPLRGDQRAIIEMNLGSVELAAGHPTIAQAAFEHALAIARAALGEGHPSLAIYLDKLAEADRARGRLHAALGHHDASLALRTAAYGDADRAVATARFHRAETLLEAGELTRAAADLEAASAIRANLLGASSPRLGEIEAVRGDVALAGGHRAEAAAHYERAALLDPRLDLRARLARDRGRVPEPPRELEPFSVDHAVLLAATARPGDRPLAAAVAARWRAEHSDDPTLAIAVAELLERAADHAGAAEAYHAALAALADEPSRLRLRALRGLAAVTPADAGLAARVTATAAALPELAP